MQGKEATLERRPDSVKNPYLESQVSVKVLINQNKPSNDELMGELGRTQQGLDLGQGDVSFQSAVQAIEDVKSMLDDELLDDDESPSPLKINKPTLMQNVSKNRSRQLNQ